jgi:hypothetical protein
MKMKLLRNPFVFLFFYILFVSPAYDLAGMGSDPEINHALNAAADDSLNPVFWNHAGSLVLLLIVSWGRGRIINKRWLIRFPLLAAVFQAIPGAGAIPVVPTLLHLFAIILGLIPMTDGSAVNTRSGSPVRQSRQWNHSWIIVLPAALPLSLTPTAEFDWKPFRIPNSPKSSTYPGCPGCGIAMSAETASRLLPADRFKRVDAPKTPG